MRLSARKRYAMGGVLERLKIAALFPGLAAAPFPKRLASEMEKVSRTDLNTLLFTKPFQLFFKLSPKEHLRLFISLLGPSQARLEDRCEPRIDHRYLASGFG